MYFARAIPYAPKCRHPFVDKGYKPFISQKIRQRDNCIVAIFGKYFCRSRTLGQIDGNLEASKNNCVTAKFMRRRYMWADKTTRGNVRRAHASPSHIKFLHLQNPRIVNNAGLFVRINERLSALRSEKYAHTGQPWFFQLARISLSSDFQCMRDCGKKKQLRVNRN